MPVARLIMIAAIRVLCLFGRRLIAISFVVTAVGCVSVPERHLLPPDLIKQAGIPGVPNVRFWGNEWPTVHKEMLASFGDAELRQFYPSVYAKPHNYLAISGGGAKGAFGAGLLLGWTATGERPEFTMVTGISTGALTAPFAFLGPDYDDDLKILYTTTNTSDIVRKRNLISAVFSDSMTDTTPLQDLIAKHIDTEIIDAIAQEYNKGRRLFISTVNLDAGRAVTWNIGVIAASDYPNKVALIHDVLRASAAIPIVFPPVMITVEAEGQQYDEMHVDGGTASQVFVYPEAMDWRLIMQKLKVQGEPHVYVIRNSFLDPDYQGVNRSLLPIAKRTIDSLIRTQGVGDLYQIYAMCVRDGNDFNLAYIPSDFTEKPSEDFDPDYMGKLFDLGYQMALDGYPWEKAPPGFILEP